MSADTEVSASTATRRHWPDWSLRLVRVLLVTTIAVASVLVLRTYVVGPYYIPSESMEPTLHGCAGCNDDHVLVDKLSYRAHSVRRRDIVVFERPRGDFAPEKVLIKRVVAVGGDRVALRGGDVYLNGRVQVEPYVNKRCGAHPTRPLTTRSTWRVPDGDVFVLGDNRCDSNDSRAFGPIPASTVVGRAFAIIWPINRIRRL